MTDVGEESRFGRRGRRLWAELATESTPEAILVLIEEACRTADRCDRLHWACKRDGIIELVERDLPAGGDGTYQIEIGSAMAEARQQGAALKALLAEIAKRQVDSPSGEDDDVLGGL
ncbi:hypothetical protein [Gordonia sp. NB41Y]|uniref:hypothetical protein n=1 Tax=Gordonia sp. NB41Y TaxID=875808 RepID=UPI0006B1D99E|nr:hypothetical protein [Gordonia sp. NB41Y]KOY49465.1 hypothetical protein ISGA_10015 [Gordonia sp. NB41Y]WLP90246.1 hypothetical protein Q9K23_22475 [Gordonia sp. NB41Y]